MVTHARALSAAVELKIHQGVLGRDLKFINIPSSLPPILSPESNSFAPGLGGDMTLLHPMQSC